MDLLLLTLAIGAATGFISGLLGIGGGLIIVPALALLFTAQLPAEAPVMHLAIGTSLATIVPTAIASTWTHHRHGAVRWRDVARLAAALMAGVALGVMVAGQLPTAWLARLFGLYALVVAVQLGFNLRPEPPADAPLQPLPRVAGAGVVIGAVSSLVGIGGGTMTTPYLLWRQRPMANAVATSAACGLPIAAIGCAGYVLAGWQAPGLPAWSSGYVYWPAFAAIAAVTVITAPLGARLTHRLPTVRLKQLFAALLAVVGLRMLVF